jgi:hypothetical protein
MPGPRNDAGAYDPRNEEPGGAQFRLTVGEDDLLLAALHRHHEGRDHERDRVALSMTREWPDAFRR